MAAQAGSTYWCEWRFPDIGHCDGMVLRIL